MLVLILHNNLFTCVRIARNQVSVPVILLSMYEFMHLYFPEVTLLVFQSIVRDSAGIAWWSPAKRDAQNAPVLLAIVLDADVLMR